MQKEPPKELRERTYAYARRIIRLFRALPRDDVARTLGRQLLRSGTSVGANHREAACSRSKAEFISKLGDCHIPGITVAAAAFNLLINRPFGHDA